MLLGFSSMTFNNTTSYNRVYWILLEWKISGPIHAYLMILFIQTIQIEQIIMYVCIEICIKIIIPKNKKIVLVYRQYMTYSHHQLYRFIFLYFLDEFVTNKIVQKSITVQRTHKKKW